VLPFFLSTVQGNVCVFFLLIKGQDCVARTGGRKSACGEVGGIKKCILSRAVPRKREHLSSNKQCQTGLGYLHRGETNGFFNTHITMFTYVPHLNNSLSALARGVVTFPLEKKTKSLFWNINRRFRRRSTWPVQETREMYNE
jgi:hypothetical protein